MSIKSDKWIKQMAESHKMIEPYESGQVRKGKNDERLISYGTSSYGYDVRCSSEFKVFTNIHSATVDPKNFDENSFVDVKSDVCVTFKGRVRCKNYLFSLVKFCSRKKFFKR